MTTGIEWTDETWNPVTGCTKVSPGCDHCYAERITNRFGGPGAFDTVVLHPERLDIPLRWRKPRRIFTCSMADLFHDDVPNEFIAQVFAVMALTPEHTYQVLTKRPGPMASLVSRPAFEESVDLAVRDWPSHGSGRRVRDRTFGWPLPNVWLGTSVETQKWADVRIPKLLQTPAAVRFLSCEPLLGPIDFEFLGELELPADIDGAPYAGGIDWVIVGGESGPDARPMDVRWARSLVEQCRGAGTPVFVKQLGALPGFRLQDEERRGNAMPSFHHFDEQSGLYIKAMNDKKGGDPSEWPEELRVREMPGRAS